MSTTCEACSSTRVENARLTSVAVQPERAGTFAKLQAGAEVRVIVCLDCGHLSGFKADVTRLNAMIRD